MEGEGLNLEIGELEKGAVSSEISRQEELQENFLANLQRILKAK